MKGEILDFSVQTNAGVISGDDGNRYSFAGNNWQESSVPQRGQRVDFQPDADIAIGIYAELAEVVPLNINPNPSGTSTPPQVKSKIAAGLLAIFLGGLGIHKFYLGYLGVGFLYLALWLVALASACTIIGLVVAIPLSLTIWVITLVEGIIYLTKSDEEFHQTYVVNQRLFF